MKGEGECKKYLLTKMSFLCIICRDTTYREATHQSKNRRSLTMKQPHTDPHKNLPLTEATYLILLSLVPAPKHGYAIMKDVQTLSDARVTLSTGTLYGVIKRLLNQDWIERVGETEAVPESKGKSGRSRKFYTLTRMGKLVLNAETNRLQALVSVAHQRTAEEQA
jgi:DNA-binding PadR family transcriptional regulator